eukprot:scaffold51410_cov36-Prasinocladus_malaysianus.AAC.7
MDSPSDSKLKLAMVDGTANGYSPDVDYKWHWDVPGVSLESFAFEGQVSSQRLQVASEGLAEARSSQITFTCQMTNTTTGASLDISSTYTLNEPPFCALAKGSPASCFQILPILALIYIKLSSYKILKLQPDELKALEAELMRAG